MLGSLKNSIMPQVLPFFRLQRVFLCSRNRSRLNFDGRVVPKYPCLDASSSTRSDTEFRLPIHFRQVIFENRLGNINGGEHVGDQADGQGDGKPTDGSGAKQEQEEGG